MQLLYWLVPALPSRKNCASFPGDDISQREVYTHTAVLSQLSPQNPVSPIRW